LKQFNRAGILSGCRFLFRKSPPRVEYHMTEFGRKFLKLLREVEKLQAELNGTTPGKAKTVRLKK